MKHYYSFILLFSVLQFTGQLVFAQTGCTGDCVNGYGVYQFAGGDLYKGNWLNGLKSGTGTYTWADGSSYTGDWLKDMMHGEGTFLDTDGTVMTGPFENDEYLGDDDVDATLASNICTALQLVIDEFDHDFADIKGEKVEEGSSTKWTSKVLVVGSESDPTISKTIDSQHSIWNCNLLETDSYHEALEMYKDYVKVIRNCGYDCCTVGEEQNEFEGDSYTSYLTFWVTSIVGDGYSSGYQDLIIEIGVTSGISDDWSIDLRVYSTKDV